MKGNGNGVFNRSYYYINFNNKINDALSIFLKRGFAYKNTVTTNVTVFTYNLRTK